METEVNSIDHIKKLMRSDVAEAGKYLCPICNEMIDCKGNVALFNKHVDKCLIQSEKLHNPTNTVDNNDNKSEGVSVKSKTTKTTKSKKSPTSTLTDFFKKP